MSDLVRFDGVALGYGRRTILSGLSFAVSEGDFLGLVGPNGAGKTTVLRAILGTLAPQEGTLVRSDALRFGYVPQRDQVDYNFPLKVLDVVLMGRYDRIGLGRRPGKDDRARAMAALEHVGIPELAGRQLKDLSGGQKQRALIARALVGEPNVLVLDEPTNGMDLVSTTQILGLVRELHERDGLTVIMVSHALNEVANYVERIALVVGGGFRIGTVDEIMTEPVLSEMYGIPVEVDSFEGHRIVLARRFAPGQEAHRA
ncbi:metal ABC transporter ATP-binding protein [Longimicrobium sp.]|uniref:metal ABC transporter ATP-binding protein n=1 Tax=Longimicrobium sp. TaxID=2029185 RepID=UPI002C20C90B|nr:metal ABC transporter ATP-binding protein [Longimicrobium sp.]HSU13226.1 metal ABC transporter ATP-binding protein [Longimicrobium sp.]